MYKSKQEISAMPTILDVLENIATPDNSEEIDYCQSFFGPTMRDDNFLVTEDHSNHKISLIPCSQSGPFMLFRGQNEYHPICKPSLFRGLPDEDRIVIDRIKQIEFSDIISTHPIIQELTNQHFNIDYNAISQHYGFPTNMLDITSNKWTAAFFATTRFRNGKYEPVKENFKDGYGVIYKLKSGLDLSDYLDRIHPVGFQFLKCPSRQHAWGCILQENENFNDLPYFERVEFRHNLQASQWIYEMSYRQRRYFPQDYIAQLADNLRSTETISRKALEECHSFYYKDKPITFLTDICQRKRVYIEEIPSAHLDNNSEKKDWTEWCNFGRQELYSKKTIVYPISYASGF